MPWFRRPPPSEFAAGVADSLIRDPASWDFNGSETAIHNDKAALDIVIAIGIYFGEVRTMRPNSGTWKIDQFKGADMRAFRKAFRRWREFTEFERKEIAEARKRQALEILSKLGR